MAVNPVLSKELGDTRSRAIANPLSHFFFFFFVIFKMTAQNFVRMVDAACRDSAFVR